MNEQGTATPRAAGPALLALVAAVGVIAVLLLGDAWSGWAVYPLLTVGVLVVAGSLGALVKVLRHDG
ncbi:hypothetical protein [Streptomyces physcomitrii]|uniref:Integral membrane protein n=1 Tax=Streptomyces physcomitrii TaxID=2724184 RepID=A0ABX1GXM1_9ACTN|nr:hypothetical protein [Streptomyces physcomitrii]NKI40841.1 hypothetical protein [Streptomyces physcomitrii]